MDLVLLSLEKRSLNGNKYDFSVHYSSTNKSNILKIHRYLMIKNDV